MPRLRLLALRLLRSASSSSKADAHSPFLAAGGQHESDLLGSTSIFSSWGSCSRPCIPSSLVSITSDTALVTRARNDSFFSHRPHCRRLSGFSSKVIFDQGQIEKNDGPLPDSSVAEHPLCDTELRGAEQSFSDQLNYVEDESSLGREDSFIILNTSDSSGKSPCTVCEAEVLSELSSSASTDQYLSEEVESDTDLSELSELELEEEKWQHSEFCHEGGAECMESSAELHESNLLKLQELSDILPSSDGSDKSIATISEPREAHHGRSYLHVLSVDEIREILEKARAKDVTILNVRECCEWVDHMVFASGRSARHLRGMADALVYKVKQLSENVGPNSFPTVEGRDGEQWMAIDCGGIVVHLLLEQARSYYDLEEIWRKKKNPRLMENF